MHPFYYINQVKIEPNETLHMSRPFESCVLKLKNRLEKYMILITTLNDLNIQFKYDLRFKTNCLTMTEHVWFFLWVATIKKKLKCITWTEIILSTPYVSIFGDKIVLSMVFHSGQWSESGRRRKKNSVSRVSDDKFAADANRSDRKISKTVAGC